MKTYLKTYLGDGVYAEVLMDGTLILTTENGLETTNTIFLEPNVLESLQDIVRKIEELRKEKEEG